MTWWDQVIMRMQQRVDPNRFPGAAFGFQIGQQAPLMGAVGQGWGMNKIVGVGSLSKALVATALLKLMQKESSTFPQGEQTLLMNIPPTAAYRNYGPRKQQLTLFHLLTHTS